jgi:hypothetical protein
MCDIKIGVCVVEHMHNTAVIHSAHAGMGTAQRCAAHMYDDVDTCK